MHFTLTKDLEKFVVEKTRGGGYADASEVVREALRLHIRQQWEHSIERRAAAGRAEADAGLGVEATDAFFEGLRRSVRAAARNA